MDSSLKVLQDPGANVTDPICGMQFPPEKAAGKLAYEGKTYYFCSPGCKRSFDKDPEKYLGAGAQHSHEH